jgi:hypothetical protein
MEGFSQAPQRHGSRLQGNRQRGRGIPPDQGLAPFSLDNGRRSTLQASVDAHADPEEIQGTDASV